MRGFSAFKKLTFFISIIGVLFLWSCSDSAETPELQPIVNQTMARFDVTTGNPADIPIPNDMLRNPFTGQLAVPGGDTNPAIAALNTLYGFSTSAPIFIPFDGPVDATTVSNESIFVVDLTTFQHANIKFQTLTNPQTGDSTVIGTPMMPLKPATPYIVIVTPTVLGMDGYPVTAPGLVSLLKSSDSFVDADGHSTQSALDDATAAQLEPLRQMYQTIWSKAEAIAGLSRYQYSIAFTFTTQPLFQTLPALRTAAQSLNPTPTVLQAYPVPAAVDAFFNGIGLGAAPHDAIGALYYGSFEAPNYLQQHPAGLGPIGPFTYVDGQLQQLGTSQITFWACIPASASGPVPVMIFQHGLGRSKEDMFAIANTANALGVGMIGIDIVLHGDRSSDFFNNGTGEQGPDGIPDPSGTGFINLLNPLLTRDAPRQTVSDLFVLTRMLTSGATDFNGDTIPDFAPVGLTYIGQSLGGLMGSVFAGLEPNVSLACLNVPGGRVSNLLTNSVSISASINPALEAAAGIVPGTPDYMIFWMIFQSVIDDADPFNYAPYFTSGGLAGNVPTTVLVQEMENDLVVPNSATEDLVRAMGLPQVSAQWVYEGQTQVEAPYVGSGHFQFTGGAHGFILDPNQGPTVAGQTQAMTFLLQGLQGNPVIIDPFAGAGKTVTGPYRGLENSRFEQSFDFTHLTRCYQP